MKTLHLPTTEATVDLLKKKIEAGNVLHGRAELDLDKLKPRTSTALRVDERTGERLKNEKVVLATDVWVLAVFCATMFEPSTGLYGCSFRKQLLPDVPNAHSGYEFFVTDAGKQIVKEREKAGQLSAVYFADRHLFRPQGYDWEATHTVKVFGSVAVSTLCLPFDFRTLPEPESDPDIAEYHRRFGDIPPDQA